jgi:hypothetical protein
LTTIEKIKKIIKTILAIWGAISLVGLFALAGYLYYSLGPGNKTVDDRASNNDVRFVLNWCRLGDHRIEKVLHSHISARSFSGDHLDAYSIKIKNIKIDELTNKTDTIGGRWYRGDMLPKILSDALTSVCAWQHKTPWFPKESEIRSSDFYIYPWSIHCQGILPSGAQIILVNPEEKIVYYISAES